MYNFSIGTKLQPFDPPGIGKYKPITAGFVINDCKIKSSHVIVYREQHGYEIKYPTFLSQFKFSPTDLRIAVDTKHGACAETWQHIFKELSLTDSNIIHAEPLDDFGNQSPNPTDVKGLYDLITL